MWFQFLDSDIQGLVFYGGIRTQHIEIVPSFHLPNVTITGSEAIQTIKAILSLSGSTKKRLYIALERLNRAIRRFDVGDKSLDLAIALETLLADNQGENTYKVALRAGLLDSDDLESRRRTRAFISALYGIRSAVVHSGEAPKKVNVKEFGQQSSYDIVIESIGIVAKLIRRIACRGVLPDWHRFELGIL